ncbi:myosin-IIIa-like [Oscarella lobularis]|uniref:myosin-IIIa-like n=1 Tax=Oscarella lobularis TaxID=121494 RepID=UPI0033140246
MAKALLRRCSEDVLATFYAAGLSPINVEKEWQKGDYVGGGAFGEVYEGTNRRTGQRVAIKVINSIAVGGLSYNTILTEMRVLKYDSEHENITKFYGAYRHKDAITEKQEIWLIMELCQGGSVGDIVKFLAKNGEHLDEPIIAYILQEVIKALSYLHNRLVMHRDIKGQNIMLTADGGVRLIDFGISCKLDASQNRRISSVGTSHWMPPEVIFCDKDPEGCDYDVRCDVWSLGITAIELAEGQPPHGELSSDEIRYHIPRNEPPSLRDPLHWSTTFKAFLARCLKKWCDDRPFFDELLADPFIQTCPKNPSDAKSTLVKLSRRCRESKDKTETILTPGGSRRRKPGKAY